MIAAIALLALLTVSSVANLLITMKLDGRGVDANCIYLQYPYDAEDEEDEASFSGMGPQDRALADLYDCDIRGR